LSIPLNARVVGTVGRLNEVKRQDHLIRAAAGLGVGYKDVHLLLVGDGPERAALERLAESLGLSARVHFAGYQSAPERFLPAMDIFALTSRLEGLPLALLEAWAASLPVVSSAVGGVPKVVREGETGLLFPNGNEPALTAALRDLLSDPAKAARMAATGLAVVRKEYSLERMASEYEAYYRAILAGRRGGQQCESSR
jgi:glycosyltransferase involved in cell wall biosynthesis